MLSLLAIGLMDWQTLERLPVQDQIDHVTAYIQATGTTAVLCAEYVRWAVRNSRRWSDIEKGFLNV